MVRVAAVVCSLWYGAGLAGALVEPFQAVQVEYRDQFARGSNVLVRSIQAVRSAFSWGGLAEWLRAELDRIALVLLSCLVILARPATLRSVLHRLKVHPMDDRTWFTLLMRAIGILVLAFTLPDIGLLLVWGYQRAGGAAFNSYLTAEYALTTALRIGIGFYLLLGGGWIIRLCQRDLAGHCRACGYALQDAPGSLCPECGTAVPGRAPAPDAAKE